MFQIRNVTLTHKKDLHTIVSDFSLVLNDGDRAVLIGEEGNGKSTLIKWIYDPELVEDYIEYKGEKSTGGERLAYLPQELPESEKTKSVYEYFTDCPEFAEMSPSGTGILLPRSSDGNALGRRAREGADDAHFVREADDSPARRALERHRYRDAHMDGIVHQRLAACSFIYLARRDADRADRQPRDSF